MGPHGKGGSPGDIWGRSWTETSRLWASSQSSIIWGSLGFQASMTVEAGQQRPRHLGDKRESSFS